MTLCNDWDSKEAVSQFTYLHNHSKLAWYKSYNVNLCSLKSHFKSTPIVIGVNIVIHEVSTYLKIENKTVIEVMIISTIVN